METVDDRMAALADELPGFAGIYFDSSGSMNVRLVNTDQATAARDLLATWFMARDDPWSRSEGASRASEAVVRGATWDYRQLHSWFLVISRDLLALDGVKSGAISSRRNEIVIKVNQQDLVSRMREQVSDLGVPDAAVAIEYRPGRVVGARATDLDDRVRPVIGGLSISHTNDDNCTLSYNADHSSSVDWYFITASHCTNTLNGLDGGSFPQAQPNANGSNDIGVEVSDPATFDHDDDNSCPMGAVCRYADVALFEYTGPTTDWKHGYVAYPASIGGTSYSVEKRVIGNADPLEGQWVYKVGITTGRSYGQVDEDCATYVNEDTDVTLPCQVVVADERADHGDSGGPVFATSGSHIIARGILWGFDEEEEIYVASPIQAALGELNADFGGTLCLNIACTPDPFVTIVGPTYLPPGLACQWSTAASGGVPPYSFSWSGVFTGGGTPITKIVNSSGWLNVTNTDDVGNEGHDSVWITVSSSAPAPPGCQE